MTLEQAIIQTRECAERMDALYKRPVFDEWTIVRLSENKGRFLMYQGPRRSGFEKSFLEDAKPLRGDLLSGRHIAGDFEFARHGHGTKFDAFMVLGEGVFLICNNTSSSIDEITKDPLWLSAQIPFAELGDTVRSSPVACSA